jgi:hypothetical protein
MTSRRGAVRVNPVTGKMEKLENPPVGADGVTKHRDGCMVIDNRYINAAKELGLGGEDGASPGRRAGRVARRDGGRVGPRERRENGGRSPHFPGPRDVPLVVASARGRGVVAPRLPRASAPEMCLRPAWTGRRTRRAESARTRAV